MFKKHSMQIKMVKDNTANNIGAELNIDPKKINYIVKESVKNIGIAVVATVGSLIVLNTAGTIAINAAPKR